VPHHIYFGIENLSLSGSQRDELVQVLCMLGPAGNPQPACLCHWRTRLDGEAVIFEALFDEDNVGIYSFKKWLGATFGVSPATIGHRTATQVLGTLPTIVVTFARSSTDYLRVALFGYDGVTWPTWVESSNECRAYLQANLSEWEPGDG